MVCFAAVDVGGSGGAEDGGDVVSIDEAVELGGVGSYGFEIEMQPVGRLCAASGRKRGGAELLDELRAELAGGAEDEHSAGRQRNGIG